MVNSPALFRLTALGFVLTLSAVARAAADLPAADPVVELPKFTVTETPMLPPPESWRYVQFPGFEVLTNASDKATQRLLDDFDQFRLVLGVVWPLPDKPSPPVSLILCGKGGKFDAFLPAGQTGPDRALASLLLKAREQTAIVVDLETSVVNISGQVPDDPATGTDTSQIAVDHNKLLFREYVQYLLSKAEPRLPTWYEEGMSQIVMATTFTRKLIVFGKLENPNAVSAAAAQVASSNAMALAADPDALVQGGAPAEDRDFNGALKQRRLMPLAQLFGVTRDSPEALNALGNNLWAKECYAFVHLCLYGEGKRYNQAFAEFLARASKQPVTEEMFKDCFKMSYKDMLLQIRGYIDVTPYESKEFKIKGDGLPLPPKLVMRDATQSEIGRIKGGALLAAGHRDAARAELIAPYIRGERDPQLLAELGIFQHSIGDNERARKLLEAAIPAKIIRPRAYLELAQFRYADAVAQPGAAAGFSPTQTRGIVDLLLIARTQPPALSEVYDVLADTWARSATPPTKDDIAVLIEGLKLFPGRLGLVYQTASLSARIGMPQAAASLIAYGLSVTTNPAAKARFEELKASLPVATASASPAGKSP